MTSLICFCPFTADGVEWELLTSVSHQPVKISLPGLSAQLGRCGSRRTPRWGVASLNPESLRRQRTIARNLAGDSVTQLFAGSRCAALPRSETWTLLAPRVCHPAQFAFCGLCPRKLLCRHSGWPVSYDSFPLRVRSCPEPDHIQANSVMILCMLSFRFSLPCLLLT